VFVLLTGKIQFPPKTYKLYTSFTNCELSYILYFRIAVDIQRKLRFQTLTFYSSWLIQYEWYYIQLCDSVMEICND